MILSRRPNDDDGRDGFTKWPFMTTHTWGEDPRGRWTLEVWKIIILDNQEIELQGHFCKIGLLFTGPLQYTEWQQADWLATWVDFDATRNSRRTLYWIASCWPALQTSNRKESTWRAQESSQVNSRRITTDFEKFTLIFLLTKKN